MLRLRIAVVRRSLITWACSVVSTCRSRLSTVGSSVASPPVSPSTSAPLVAGTSTWTSVVPSDGRTYGMLGVDMMVTVDGDAAVMRTAATSSTSSAPSTSSASSVSAAS